MQLQPKNLLSNLLSTRRVFLDSDKNMYLVLGTKEKSFIENTKKCFWGYYTDFEIVSTHVIPKFIPVWILKKHQLRDRL